MIKYLKKNIQTLLPKNKFARNVSVLVSGTTGAQILLILSIPFLTRLYTPEDFGILAVYASLLSFIVVIASLRYELAIPLPKNEVEAANVAFLSLLLVIVITILTGIVVLIFGSSIIKLMNVPLLANHLWLLPVGVFFSGVYTVFNYCSIRRKHYKSIAYAEFTKSVVSIVTQFTVFKLGSIGLLLGQVVSQIVGTTTLAKSALSMPRFKQISWRGVCQIAKRFRQFPIFSTWNSLLNTAGLYFPPLLLAIFFGPISAGLYSIANRVLNLPASIIGRAVGQVFFTDASKARREKNLGPLISKILEKLLSFSIPPALFIILIAPSFFSFVFGDEWKMAGEFASLMVPWIILSFIFSPVSTLFVVMEKQKQFFLMQIILLFMRFLAFLLGIILNDIWITIAAFSLASAFCYFLFIIYANYVVGNSFFNLFRFLLNNFLIAILVAFPILFTTNFLLDKINILLPLSLLVSCTILIAHYWRLFSLAYK
jgi:O-antigen/teichoic acid export membrane protein